MSGVAVIGDARRTRAARVGVPGAPDGPFATADRTLYRGAMRGLVVVALLGVSSMALAKDSAAAKEHYLKGTRAFELGAYDEAIDEYSAAYRIKDDPALLYNLGQAHRLAGHAVEALRFYKLFLIKVPQTPARSEVEQKIAELQKLVDQQQKTRSIPPDTVKSPEQPTTVTTTPEAPPATTEPPPSQGASASPPPSSGRTKMIVGGVVGGVGVVMTVVGIAFGVLAKQSSDKLTQLDRTMQPFDYGQQQAGKTDQIVEGVFLGVGIAAVAAGAVVLALGHRESRRPASMAIVPTLHGAEVRF